MGKHGDDKNGNKKAPDPSQWEKPKNDGGGKHDKNDPKK